MNTCTIISCRVCGYDGPGVRFVAHAKKFGTKEAFAYGACLIRIPLVDSLLLEKYGDDWVELDAPRHLYLHSPKSINVIAVQVNRAIYSTMFESTEFEFSGSKRYRREISLLAELSWMRSPERSIVTNDQIAEYRNAVNDANRSGRGRRGGAFFFREP